MPSGERERKGERERRRTIKQLPTQGCEGKKFVKSKVHLKHGKKNDESRARVEQPVKLGKRRSRQKWCVFDLHDLVVRIEVKEKVRCCQRRGMQSKVLRALNSINSIFDETLPAGRRLSSLFLSLLGIRILVFTLD